MPVRRILITLLCASSLALAADEEMPEIEFLEYLGLWEGTDEDWTMFSDLVEATDQTNRRSDPAPKGKESTEKDDED
jgi:hypothetical protein